MYERFDQRSKLLLRTEEDKPFVLLHLLYGFRFLCELWVHCNIVATLNISEAALQNGTVVVFYAGLDNL